MTKSPRGQRIRTVEEHIADEAKGNELALACQVYLRRQSSHEQVVKNEIAEPEACAKKVAERAVSIGG